MKNLLTSILLVTISFITFVEATPDRCIKSTTTLIGSTSETYTTQTKTLDNQGSYYLSIKTIILNTYQKTKSQSIPIKTITRQEAKKVIYGDAYSKDPVSTDKIQETDLYEKCPLTQ